MRFALMATLLALPVLSACDTLEAQRSHTPEEQAAIWDCATGAERRNNADFNTCIGGWENQ